MIGGDLCPIGRNMPLFQAGDAPALFGDLLPEFEKVDLSIVNLECPLIREETPIEKSGPILGAPEACINGLKAAGIDVANLANNHIMDHGPQGLRSTIETCRRNGIDYVGVGENLQEAHRICVWDVKGMRIGVLSLAEHEFSIASKNTPGGSWGNRACVKANLKGWKNYRRLFHSLKNEKQFPLVVWALARRD